MMNKAIDINNKAYTDQLIEYLEGVIADEMLLNSFIRNINISDVTSTEVVVEVVSSTALDIIKTDYLSHFTQAIENVFEKKLEPRIVLYGETVKKNKYISLSKNISSKYTFNSYVKSDFNKEVINIAKKIIDKPGKYSPFYIASKSGLGKTHLLHAIGNEVIKKGLSVAYVEPNKFTKDIQILSQQGGTAISQYADELKNYDFLLFDDIQNLGDRSVTLKVLFEIINSHIENDKQFVIVSDRTAQELSGFESRFITRFISGISSTIKEPTEEDITKILIDKLKREDLDPKEWEKDALSFIARNNMTSIRSLEGAIKRISYYTESDNDVQYTYTTVSNIFKNLVVDPSELTPDRIINTVAAYYKITKKDIIGKSRRKEFITPRHICIYLIRSICKIGYIDIGKIFSNRDHSTIISASKKIDKELKMNEAVKMAVGMIEQKIKTLN